MSKEHYIEFASSGRRGEPGPLAQGLRADYKQGRNIPQLIDCRSVEARPQGLVEYDQITQPISTATLTAASITVNHPFPQLFRLSTVTLLGTATALYTVTESTWAISAITTYNLLTPASTKAITSGGPWHVADFMGTHILFNGECVVFKFANDVKYYVQDAVSTAAGCAHRGRLVMGGFDTSDYWSSTWKTKWTALINQTNPPNGNILQTMVDVGPNWIWWSTIGGGDVRFFYDPTYANTGSLSVGHTTANPLFLDYAYRNEWGWMPMPFRESVLAIHPLGRRIAVFGGDGYAVLQQSTDPTPTYGLLLHEPVGLASRSAVGGDERSCVFVDESGCLWSLEADGGPQRLGYEEFLAPLLGENFVVSMDPFRRDFYICGETAAYLLTASGGFTEIPQLLTNGISVGGGFVGIREQLADQSFSLTTDQFDMGISGLKQVYGVSLTGEGFEGMTLKFQYRMEPGASWITTNAVPINPSGFAVLEVAGWEFRAILTRTSSTGVSLQNMRIRWKSHDRRELSGGSR